MEDHVTSGFLLQSTLFHSSGHLIFLIKMCILTSTNHESSSVEYLQLSSTRYSQLSARPPKFPYRQSDKGGLSVRPKTALAPNILLMSAAIRSRPSRVDFQDDSQSFFLVWSLFLSFLQCSRYRIGWRQLQRRQKSRTRELDSSEDPVAWVGYQALNNKMNMN